MSFFERVKVEPGSEPIQITPTEGPGNDAFGRLRVAEPKTLFDGKTLADISPLKFDDQEVSGGGTSSAFQTNQSSVRLSVSGTTAGRRVRQTYLRFNYIPGKSHLIKATFVMGSTSAGVKKKVGYFDDRNGIFLMVDGDTTKIVWRTYTSGVAVDTEVAQAAWNEDPLDGTGPSGITLDITKSQILIIDLEWLGVGRVRIGFNINGVTYYTHEFNNSNILDVVYMGSPNLPIRYEIENDGTGAADSMDCICSTVISEGGQDPIGLPFGIANSAIRTNINGTGTTRYGLIGIRLKSTHAETAVVIPTLMSMIGSTPNDAYCWELVLNPTVAGSPTWSSLSNSAVEWVDGSSVNTITGGTVLMSGVGFSQTAGISLDPRDLLQLGVSISGTPQTLWAVIRPYQNMSALAGLSWRELG